MTQRNVVLFECLAFGAPHWNDPAEAVQMAKSVTEALVRELEAGGGPCTVEPVAPHGTYGWEFFAVHGGTRIWCLLQRSDAWLLITEPRRALVDRLHHSPFETDHRIVCDALDAAVRRLAGVTDVRWMTLEEFHAGSSRTRH